jgi:hypothetical protein
MVQTLRRGWRVFLAEHLAAFPAGPDDPAFRSRTGGPIWANTFNNSGTAQARATVIDRCYGFYNHQRRHSAAAGLSPINYETTALNRDAT